MKFVEETDLGGPALWAEQGGNHYRIVRRASLVVPARELWPELIAKVTGAFSPDLTCGECFRPSSQVAGLGPWFCASCGRWL